MQWKDFDGEGFLVIPEKGDVLEVANRHKCPAPLLTMLKRLQKARKPNPDPSHSAQLLGKALV